eukprot:TRINITY_DN133_c0_g1_i4.p1 TRINITY_DN133_c0_g1~~TRINITY_DN133_c0_g1_i4.p1  ORF type:complete len:427 (-),score=103.59 TRINITY_DN133_c0_g1_i4:1207-2487(-)
MGPPCNLFNIVQERRLGGRRPRLREAQLTLLRLRQRWSVDGAHASPPWSPAGVKDVVQLGMDLFCVVTQVGLADVYRVEADGSCAWIRDLRVSAEERVKLVANLRDSKSLLVVYSIAVPGLWRQLCVRVLDFSSATTSAGDLVVRDCGELSSVVVGPGGFVEVDPQNQVIFVNDLDTFRCWDAVTLRPRFVLGPFEDGVPNPRWSLGYVCLLRSLLLDEGEGHEVRLEACLYDVKDGRQLARREIPHPAMEELRLVFTEIIDTFLLVKFADVEMSVMDLLEEGAPPVAVAGTAAWAPDNFIFVPSRRLMLCSVEGYLEVWKVPTVAACARVATVREAVALQASRACVDERLGVALLLGRDSGGGSGASHAGQDGGSLLLVDLARCGKIGARLEDLGGQVQSLYCDLDQKFLVVHRRTGILAAYSVA